MKRMYLEWNKTRKCWCLAQRGADVIRYVSVGYSLSKRESVRRAAGEVRRLADRDNPISLIVRKKNGQIQEERTYPRSADPKRSPG